GFLPSEPSPSPRRGPVKSPGLDWTLEPDRGAAQEVGIRADRVRAGFSAGAGRVGILSNGGTGAHRGFRARVEMPRWSEQLSIRGGPESPGRRWGREAA